MTVVPFGTSLDEIMRVRPDGGNGIARSWRSCNLDAGLDVVAGLLEREIPTLEFVWVISWRGRSVPRQEN